MPRVTDRTGSRIRWQHRTLELQPTLAGGREAPHQGGCTSTANSCCDPKPWVPQPPAVAHLHYTFLVHQRQSGLSLGSSQSPCCTHKLLGTPCLHDRLPCPSRHGLMEHGAPCSGQAQLCHRAKTWMQASSSWLFSQCVLLESSRLCECQEPALLRTAPRVGASETETQAGLFLSPSIHGGRVAPSLILNNFTPVLMPEPTWGQGSPGARDPGAAVNLNVPLPPAKQTLRTGIPASNLACPQGGSWSHSLPSFTVALEAAQNMDCWLLGEKSGNLPRGAQHTCEHRMTPHSPGAGMLLPLPGEGQEDQVPHCPVHPRVLMVLLQCQ